MLVCIEGLNLTKKNYNSKNIHRRQFAKHLPECPGGESLILRYDELNHNAVSTVLVSLEVCSIDTQLLHRAAVIDK